ncbi:MAG: hypothetical protein RL154_1362 [Pseudomonadota bacterium]
MALQKLTLSLAAVAAMATGAFADAYGTGLADAFSKGKVDGQVRGMYDYQNNQVFGNQPNNNNSGFALGGNLGYTTAPYYGIQAGAKFYTTQVLGASSNLNGGVNNKGQNIPQASLAPFVENASSTAGTTPQSYSVLGEAFVQGTYGKTIAKIGRQTLDTPLAGGDDNYMIPNLFQAGVLINQDIPQTTLVAAYVNGMMGGTTGDSHASQSLFTGTTYGSGNAQTGFNSMSRSALGQIVGLPTNLSNGASIGNQPVIALAAVNSSIPFTTAQLWYYNNTDVLNALYFSADIAGEVAKDWKPSLSGQWYNLAAQGKTKTLLTNVGNAFPGAVNNLSYSVWGVKGGLSTPIGLTPEVAGNFVQGKNSTAFVFNAWGGVPNYTDMAFVNISNFAGYAGGLLGGNSVSARGLNVFKASLTQDLKQYNLGDRNIQVAFGSYDFSKSNNNGNNVDTSVWDVVYNCKGALVKNLDMKIFWENVKYNSAWQNVGGTNKSTNYVFARAIYGF